MLVMLINLITLIVINEESSNQRGKYMLIKTGQKNTYEKSGNPGTFIVSINEIIFKKVLSISAR